MRLVLTVLGTEVFRIETGDTGFTRTEPAPFEYDVPLHVEEC